MQLESKHPSRRKGIFDSFGFGLPFQHNTSLSVKAKRQGFGLELGLQPCVLIRDTTLTPFYQEHFHRNSASFGFGFKTRQSATKVQSGSERSPALLPTLSLRRTLKFLRIKEYRLPQYMFTFNLLSHDDVHRTSIY